MECRPCSPHQEQAVMTRLSSLSGAAGTHSTHDNNTPRIGRVLIAKAAMRQMFRSSKLSDLTRSSASRSGLTSLCKHRLSTKRAEIDLANWLEGCYTVRITARYLAVIGD